MKRAISLILAVVLVFAMSVTAFAAETVTQAGGTATANVTATYEEASPAATVYSVEISWGSMEFTYTEAADGTWSSDSHEYTDKGEAEWSYTSGANVVTVTNHSNAAVTATLAYAAKTGYEAVTGTF
ncbi:MAG: hypothetical protein LJU34_06320 [Oscillospiraceae bacterium]|nr:hypothetical protein [Oscillospiraceae bacterium]